jgi:hypothetical protein
MKSRPSLVQFQELLYSHLDNRANAVIELVNALSGNTHASFRWSSSASAPSLGVIIAICTRLSTPSLWQRRPNGALWLPSCPTPGSDPSLFLGVDVVPYPRPYAATLEDRGLVYQPRVATSNKPIAVCHAYSTPVLLTEKQPGDPAWVMPLSVRRVASEKGSRTGGRGSDTCPSPTSICLSTRTCVWR